MAQIFVSGVAHFFVVVGGSKIHERMAHFFIDIYKEQWDKVELKPFKFKNPYKRYIMEAAMETAAREAAWYDESTTKKCGDIINNHKDFFDGLSSIEEVFVIGHSLSEVDYPYFEEVRSRCDAKWHIGYHSLDDMKILSALVNKLHLKDVTVFRT